MGFCLHAEWVDVLRRCCPIMTSGSQDDNWGGWARPDKRCTTRFSEADWETGLKQGAVKRYREGSCGMGVALVSKGLGLGIKDWWKTLLLTEVRAGLYLCDRTIIVAQKFEICINLIDLGEHKVRKRYRYQQHREYAPARTIG